ncbi:M23 family metallopeptidase [candidate division WOR-3 bacterium]|nr:M23 family metallopeptidase [candidate division WOR-3 bacterium]
MRHWTVKIGNQWCPINKWQIIAVGAVVGVLVFLSISTAFLTMSINVKTAKFIKEKNRSRILKLALEHLEKKVDLLNKRTNSIVDLDKKERLVWGLPEINSDIRELGVGGESYYVDETGEKIQNLQRKLDFEFASFKEIRGGIKQKRSLLLRTPSVLPTHGAFTSGFGWRTSPFRPYGREFHEGIDIANRPGTPIYTTADGVVSNIRHSNKGLGLSIEIDHGFGYKTQYGHLSRALVKVGESVKRGQVIGKMGNTGRSTGPHLDYRVQVIGKPVNPSNYIISGTTIY